LNTDTNEIKETQPSYHIHNIFHTQFNLDNMHGKDTISA